MDPVVHGNEDQPLARRPIPSALAFEGSEPITEARSAARRFLTDVQAVHGILVSDRAMGTVQLAVSELVTNAYKYAPGPCLLDVEVSEGAVQISAWGTDPTLPAACPADPGRVGQHGLEIIMAMCQSFEVRREPVGKRVRAAVVLADDPGGDPAGRLLSPSLGAGTWRRCPPARRVVGGPLGSLMASPPPGRWPIPPANTLQVVGRPLSSLLRRPPPRPPAAASLPPSFMEAGQPASAHTATLRITHGTRSSHGPFDAYLGGPGAVAALNSGS